MLVKDLEFNKETVTKLANNLETVYPDFKKQRFIESCLEEFPKQELKQRMSHVTYMIHQYLGEDYETNIDTLSRAMNHVQKGGFIYGSVIEYIETYGCNRQYLDLSLEKLGEFTRLLSSEFAIRPFLSRFEEETLSKVYEWTKSNDVHKRRLASEGTRPSLPWGPNITVNYKVAAKVLDHLYYDSVRFVTRSCANHLNDISKIDPGFVLDTLSRWEKSKKQNKTEMDYIIKHSLRTLVKKGHLDTLAFLGLNLNPLVSISEIRLSPTELHIGDYLEIQFDLTPLEDTKLLVDYIITYPTKRGSTTTKVFKIVQFEGTTNQTKQLTRRRTFRHMSTRTMKPGNHKVSIQVNGTIIAEKDFLLHE